MPLAVNFEKWGYITDWQIDNTNYGSYFTFLKPSNTILSWTNMVTNGYQSVNADLDFSIAPWRINKKSAYVDIKGNIWFNNKNTVPSDAGKAYYNDFEILNEVKNAPFLLTRIVGSGTNFPPYDTKYWAYLINGETKSTDYISSNYQITNFRYDKIKLCPYIVTTTKTMEDGIQTNIYSGAEPWNYLPSYSDLSGLYVVAVGFRVCVEINGSWVEKPLTITIPTYFSGDTGTNYFSGENGMKILRHPAIYTIGSSTHYNTMINPQPMSIGIASSDITQGESHAIETCYSVATPITSTSTIGHGYITGTPAGFTYTERLTANAQTLSGCLYLKIDSEDLYNSFADEVKKQLAYIGLPFVLRQSYASENFGSDNVYLPVFDANRCTTGNYYNGQASLSLPNSSWQWIYELDELPPDEEPDPGTTTGDIGDLTNTVPNRYSNAGGLQQWVVSQQTLIQLGAYLNGTYLPTSADLDADFKGTDPTQYIVSVQKYPYDIPYQGTSGTIHIGKNSSGLSGYQLFATWGGIGVLPINSYVTEDFGYIEIPYFFEDFRDYQSKILLFMPFIGTVELDPRLYIGTAVKLIYNIDYNTGAVCAEIKRRAVSDDHIERWLTMETKTSTISITVPFMAANMGQYQNQLAALDYSKEMTKIKGVQTALSTGFQLGSAAIGSYSSGSAPGMGQLSAIASGTMQLAANATQLDYIDYQIEHTAPSIGTLSTASAANSFFMDDRARILIVRPQMIAGYNASKYSHTIGNACCKTGKISEFSGLLVCSTAILSDVHTRDLAPLQATEQEKKLLKAALQNGIYL